VTIDTLQQKRLDEITTTQQGVGTQRQLSIW
jgi:hypothetical protein